MSHVALVERKVSTIRTHGHVQHIHITECEIEEKHWVLEEHFHHEEKRHCAEDTEVCFLSGGLCEVEKCLRQG